MKIQEIKKEFKKLDATKMREELHTEDKVYNNKRSHKFTIDEAIKFFGLEGFVKVENEDLTK